MSHKKFPSNAPCPCGSGQADQACCYDKGFEYLVDEDGTVFKSIPVSDDLAEIIEEQKRKFQEEHGVMWILANSFIHISSTILGREYSPGVVTATTIYVPGGLCMLWLWNRKGLLTWKNTVISFVVGGMLFMLVPTFARAMHFHAQFARIFPLA